MTYNPNGAPEFEIAKLPYDWGIISGLKYPTVINLADGTRLVVPNYQTHHSLIQIACKGSQHEFSEYVASIRNQN